MYRISQFLLIIFLLTGCAGSSRHDLSVNELPTPGSYGKNLVAQQLMVVNVNDEQHQLTMALEVDEERLILAGFAGLGVPVFKVQWNGEQLSSNFYVPEIEGVPDAEQVLLDLFLVLWPLNELNTLAHQLGVVMEADDISRTITPIINHARKSAASVFTGVEVRFKQHQDIGGEIEVYRPELDMLYVLKTIYWEESQ